MSGPGFIAVQPPEKCELCGKVEECRPYGPKGENVCIECGTGTPEKRKIAERQFARKVLGIDIQ